MKELSNFEKIKNIFCGYINISSGSQLDFDSLL